MPPVRKSDHPHAERTETPLQSSGTCASRSVVYTDRGITDGMRKGIAHAEREGRVVEYRTVPGWVGA